MAQANFTPVLLYASSTAAAVPLAANLTNSATGSEIAINVTDKNLFFKDNGGAVNTVPIRQSSTSSNGWLSSTDWNTFNNKQIGNGPAFRAYNNSGAQSITTSTYTKVLFDTEVFDTNNNFASSRFTPTVAGYYQINCALAFSGTVMTRAIIGIYKNGSIDTYGNDISSAINTQIATTLVYCNGSTDYIEVYVYINATSPTITSAAAYPFSGTLVRAA